MLSFKILLSLLLLIVSSHATATELCELVMSARQLDVELTGGLQPGTQALIHTADVDGQQVILKEHESAEAMLRELEVSNAIHASSDEGHRFVVRYEPVLIGDKPYLMAPFYHRNLKDVLREVGEATIDPSQYDFAELLGNIRTGVEVIHAAGYVHSDLKPLNVVLDADFQPVIIDFGSAVRIGEKPINYTETYKSLAQMLGLPMRPHDDFEGGFSGIERDILEVVGEGVLQASD